MGMGWEQYLGRSWMGHCLRKWYRWVEVGMRHLNTRCLPPPVQRWLGVFFLYKPWENDHMTSSVTDASPKQTSTSTSQPPTPASVLNVSTTTPFANWLGHGNLIQLFFDDLAMELGTRAGLKLDVSASSLHPSPLFSSMRFVAVFSQLWGKVIIMVDYIGILEQELSSFRCLLSDQWSLQRLPLTFHFHSRKPTACTRMSPQWLTQWSSLVSMSISKVESLCVQSHQHGRLLLGSALPASFVLNSLRSTRIGMPLLSLSCHLLLTGWQAIAVLMPTTADADQNQWVFWVLCVHFIIIIIFFLAQLAVIKHELKATQEIAAAGFKTGHTGGMPHEQHLQIPLMWVVFSFTKLSEPNHIYYRSTFWDENGDDDEQGNSLVYFSLNYIETWLKKTVKKKSDVK